MNKTFNQKRLDVILEVLVMLWEKNLVHRGVIVKEAVDIADEILFRTEGCE